MLRAVVTPGIVHVVYLRGMVEKIGRGSLLVLNACRKRDLPPPVWSTDTLGVTLTFEFGGIGQGQLETSPVPRVCVSGSCCGGRS